MTLDQLLKLLSTARFPLAAAAFGVVLNFGGSNIALKNAGASLAFAATGAAVATATRKDKCLAKIRQLEQSHAAKTDALRRSVEGAIADTAKAQTLANGSKRSIGKAER